MHGSGLRAKARGSVHVPQKFHVQSCRSTERLNTSLQFNE